MTRHSGKPNYVVVRYKHRRMLGEEHPHLQSQNQNHCIYQTDKCKFKIGASVSEDFALFN